MELEKAYDKLVLSNAEVQEALRNYVTSKTGRPVRGHVVVHSKEVDGFRGQQKFHPHTEGAAHCYLEPVEALTGGQQ